MYTINVVMCSKCKVKFYVSHELLDSGGGYCPKCKTHFNTDDKIRETSPYDKNGIIKLGFTNK